MAMNIFPLCFLVLYISGTYSSGLNKTSAETDEIKIEFLHAEQSNNKISPEYKSNNENMNSLSILEDVGAITRDKEGKGQFVANNSSEDVLISSQDNSSEVHQHSNQTITQTPYSSTALDKTTPSVSKSASATALIPHFVSNLPSVVSTTTDSSSSLTHVTYISAYKKPSDSMGGSSQYFIQVTDNIPHSSNISDKATTSVSNSRSETTSISHLVSNIPGGVSSTTDSSTSLTNATHSTVDKPSSMDRMEGSSKDSYTPYSSTEVSFSQSTVSTSVTSETTELILNTSQKTTSKVVIVLAAIGGTLLVVVALLVYLKYRKKTGALPPEYLLLSP